jgi:hypothetical protein
MIYDVNSELFLRFIRAKGDKSQYLGLNTNVKSNQSKGTSFSMPVQAQSA